jgi:hypothetical protein
LSEFTREVFEMKRLQKIRPGLDLEILTQIMMAIPFRSPSSSHEIYYGKTGNIYIVYPHETKV